MDGDLLCVLPPIRQVGQQSSGLCSSPHDRVVAGDREARRVLAPRRLHPFIVLVAAPAGFGKTTLLTQWLSEARTSRRRVAWLALDPGDADAGLFLTHLVAAIQTAEPEAGIDALALLEAGGSTPTEAVLVSLINDLDVLAGPTVVALDDYHVLEGAPSMRR
jgi:LuxR family maltose regulon positive regulatory protein